MEFTPLDELRSHPNDASAATRLLTACRDHYRRHATDVAAGVEVFTALTPDFGACADVLTRLVDVEVRSRR